MSERERITDSIPLCVDLDGTLIKTDMLLELVLVVVKAKPYLLFLLPLWLIRGKAFLKYSLANECRDASHSVPFNEDVLEFVTNAKGDRSLVLVTGTDQRVAEKIAKQLNLFDRVKGSDLDSNLTGETKRAWLVSQYGEKGFDYIGNDEKDNIVWKSAREALAVSTENGITRNRESDFSKIFKVPERSFRKVLKLMRIHQWSKNILVFIPFFLNPALGDIAEFSGVVVAFFAISLLASFTYIVNDMLDLEADRNNNSKSSRPLASGAIPLLSGVKIASVLFILLLICMLWLPGVFNLVLVAYLVLTLFYSFYLKQHAVIDVCTIAALLTMRVIGGTVVIEAEWSFWLLAYSMFLFFSLAVAKRVSELTNLKNQNRSRTIGRGYEVQDIPILNGIGIATGFLSVLIVALYVNSAKVIENYHHPMLLWLVCPILMYWVGRLWLITGRGDLEEDPIEFAIRDRISLWSVALLFVIILLAKVN